MTGLVLKSSAAFSYNDCFVLSHDLLNMCHAPMLPIEGSKTGHRDSKARPLTLGLEEWEEVEEMWAENDSVSQPVDPGEGQEVTHALGVVSQG